MTNYYLVMLYKNQKFSEERRLKRLRFIRKNDTTYSIDRAEKFTLDKARKIRNGWGQDFITKHFKLIIVNENLKMVR